VRELLRYVRPEPACFVLVTGVYLAHFWHAGYDRFYHDALGYWERGELFGRDAAFSLLAFDDPIRGYSLPLVNFLLQTVADAIDVGDVTIVRISGALLAATLGVVVAPRLARVIFPGAVTTWWRVLALKGVVFLFWRDHFQFPLSDFPTLLVASVGVIGLLRRTTAGYVVAGLALGLAANMRPAYVPAALIGLLVVALLPWTAGWRARTTATALFLVPLILVSLPQVAVNHHHRGSASPTVPSPRETSLGALTWGVQAQKYETYVGPADAYPSQKVFYLDPTTRGAIDEGDLPLEDSGDYASIALGAPGAIVSNYALHLFNGLDVRYPTPYIRDLGDRPVVVPLVQFTLVFLAVLQLVLPEARRRLGKVRWIGLALLVSPILVTIAFAAEPRYFLGVHLLAYMVVCFSPALRAVVAGGVARRLSLGLAYVVVLTTCLSLSAAAQRQLEHPLGDGARSARLL
jgi:hypothetical protein